MLNDPEAAQNALLVMYAEDMYDELTDKSNPVPGIDPRVKQDWTILGFISAVDALGDAQKIGLGTRFYYGFLAQSNADKARYAAVVRGTANPSEWIEDMEFIPVSAPPRMAGKVENGFFSIYGSMRYTPLGGAEDDVVAGIARAVGGSTLTVLGHSLGSALASYLALDIAISPAFTGQLYAAMFASPHPGDGAFAQFFDQKVANYKVYNYSRDIVPHVPLLLGYSALPKATVFPPEAAQATIKNTVGGNHHAVCYAAMLNYAAANWRNMPAVDQDCTICILGPTGA